MKEAIRKIARRLAAIRFIGRFVRIAGAVWRLPQLRVDAQALRAEVDGRAAAYARIESAYREQLPSLLDAVSRLNARQHAIDQDQQNLVVSVPVALRELRRDIARIDAELIARSNEIDSVRTSTEAALGTQAARLEDHAAKLDRVHASLDELRSNCGYLFGRTEFVRRELMFQMRYGKESLDKEEDQLETKARVIATDKLEDARKTALRLNLGCGHIPLDGFINVDRRELPGVDVVAEVNDLPSDVSGADEIFSAHMLEHFPQEQLRRELLPYWKSLLKKGGVIRAVVPDAEAMIREYTAGKYPYDDMREVLYGGQDYDGDFHFNMFTPEHMKGLLEEAGFEAVTLIEAGRKNGKCYEFEIAAKRP